MSQTLNIKDFYIVPLPANTSLPSTLLPLDGPGLGDVKTHLLISIIIRQKKKRPGSMTPQDIVPAKVSWNQSKHGNVNKYLFMKFWRVYFSCTYYSVLLYMYIISIRLYITSVSWYIYNMEIMNEDNICRNSFQTKYYKLYHYDMWYL